MSARAIFTIASLLLYLSDVTEGQNNDDDLELFYSFADGEHSQAEVMNLINLINEHVGFQKIRGTQPEMGEQKKVVEGITRKSFFYFFPRDIYNEEMINKIKDKFEKQTSEPNEERDDEKQTDGDEEYQTVVIYQLAEGTFDPIVIKNLILELNKQVGSNGTKLITTFGSLKNSKPKQKRRSEDSNTQMQRRKPQEPPKKSEDPADETEDLKPRKSLELFLEFQENSYDPEDVNELVNEINRQVGLKNVDEEELRITNGAAKNPEEEKTTFYHLPNGSYEPGKISDKLKALNIPQIYKQLNGNFSIFYRIVGEFDEVKIRNLVRKLDDWTGVLGRRELTIFEPKQTMLHDDLQTKQDNNDSFKRSSKFMNSLRNPRKKISTNCHKWNLC